MKERRKAGATHSFRLTREAADLVDSINHPRRLGGKSRKISEAIQWYFTNIDDRESVDQIFASRKFWKERHDKVLDEHDKLLNERHIKKEAAKNPESGSKPPAWWRRFLLWEF